MEGVASGAAGAFVFHSRPRCSLTRGQAHQVFWALAAVCFGVAIAFSALGYWLVLPFAGLEVGLLAWAFEAMRNLVENSVLDGYQGKIAPKNIGKSPRFNKMDIRISQELPFVLGGKVQVFADVGVRQAGVEE